jgi:hypothetical protein
MTVADFVAVSTRLGGYGGRWQDEPEPSLRLDADLIAFELADGRCQCGQHRRGCPNPDAHNCCRPEHDLASWDPTVCRLEAFVAQAVRGSAVAGIRSGALTSGMLYPLLHEAFGLRVDSAEFKLCRRCYPEVMDEIQREDRETQDPDASPITGSEKQGSRAPQTTGLLKFEGPMCPALDRDDAANQCRTPALRQHTYYFARKNWALIPLDFGGSYEMVPRWKCWRCENLLISKKDPCPICHEGEPELRPQARPTNVWVRVGGSPAPIAPEELVP